jgi:hypothetical protein
MGLDQRNFLLSESGLAVSQQSFLSSSYRSNTSDVSILIERSPATLSLRDDIAAAVREIYAAVDYVVTMVSAGQQPGREDPLTAAGSTAAARLATAARGNAASYSPAWRFDLGLRLAATDLLPGEKKRAVIYVGTGLVGGETDGPRAFEQYSLSELAAYLSNNNIVFYAVIIGGGAPGGEIRYLCEETGGQALSLYRSEGIAPELRKLSERPTGSYTLSYRSALPTDFGRAYLPIEVEVYLMERSGRDSTGYFAPLQ